MGSPSSRSSTETSPSTWRRSRPTGAAWSSFVTRCEDGRRPRSASTSEADEGVVMKELTSTGWIVAKGVLFAVIAAASAGLLFLEIPTLRGAALLAILTWASCRFYYFLFYVLERYVDPDLRYAGLIALVGALRRMRRLDEQAR